jgi:hypothetical protein
MKIIDRAIRRRRSRRPAHVVDRIRVNSPAEADALRERLTAAGLSMTPTDNPRPRTDADFRQVTLAVVNWQAVMVDELAARQGIAPERFMSAILSEGLYEAYIEVMAQRNDLIRAAKRAAAPRPAPVEADDMPPGAVGQGDLDDDIPF